MPQQKRWFWQTTLAAVNQHLDAQVAMLKSSIISDIGLKTISKAA
ncbi:mobile element protein [hydrocarbon metagenome]|uniref:Mobile element protein n=1 Tax=hydrocarbon metagenome TaxID=938273 RepID=A0A0W8E3Y5_9ZZZZ